MLIEDLPLKMRFETLLRSWRRETLKTSSRTEIVSNEHYLQIIGLGFPVVPLLLVELLNGPEHLDWALKSI